MNCPEKSDTDRRDELRLVLLGKQGSGKSASGNTLLGASVFASRLSPSLVTQQCEEKTVTLGIKKVKVVDTPGLNTSMVTDRDKQRLVQCLQLLAPGPHVFLLVIRLGRFTQEEKDIAERVLEIFGKRSYMFTIILFTFKDSLKNVSIDDYISGAGKSLQQLVKECGSRYHAFNNESPGEKDQVEKLLMKIDELLAANGGICYSKEEEDMENLATRVMRQHLEDNTASNDVCRYRNRSSNHELHFGVQNDSKNSENSPIKNLLSKLHLEDYYPQKMKEATACCISKTVFQKGQPLTEKDLAFTYLYKLLTLDYRARYVSVSGNIQIDRDKVDIMSEEDFDDFIREDSQCSNENENTLIHPMDIQMAIFHCSDRLLRQEIVTKLSSCQYALPLLVTNPLSAETELPLWTFRQIKKKWKSDDGQSRTVPVCQIKTPMVCFYRVGSVSASKSQLLNSLINPKHDTFFHRDCIGSTKTRLLVEGLVEIAWYCPAGKSDDIFNECIAFCNLHGDALEHIDKTNFLESEATVNVVMMQNIKLDDKQKELLHKFSKSPKPLICLFIEQPKCPLKLGSGYKIRIGLKDRSQAELCKELITAIKTCLKKSGQSSEFKLDQISATVKHHGIRVDEDSKECHEGKIKALEVMKVLKGEKLSLIKGKFLPCQGELWHNWSQKNKELYRLKGNVEQTKSQIQQDMEAIRNQQRKSSNSVLISAVYKNLKTVQSSAYFVRWLAVFVDDLFSEKFSEVIQQYFEKWSETHTLKQQEISDDLRKNQKELERLSQEVQAMSFGLEHIVREMGQIYEAWASLPDQMAAEVSSFPALAAELLISGHPLELMDGDAAHVPLIWIQSVLDSVIDRLGDQRVYVLSVLGLQSTGKSTMLNAMFGLQFAVSAGRCTRGAFMQLIKVKKDITERFDYLLVVDTEGLRSLELSGNQVSTVTHDNELATFVTGVANMTLINISGENSAEIQDILQIVVQAFLRVKEVKLSPSCMFVHQNVTDISATEKNMEGRRRLQEKLDEMTRMAATQEVCNAECFADVIKFDIEKDVHYFAQLWEGNPPMAPPNPRYSENIEKLKEAILISAAKQTSLRFSKLRVLIKDMWNAVMNEDFVFSFKNTVEIAAYRKLEVMYGNWTWTLRNEMLSTENMLHNKIENGNLQFCSQSLINEKTGPVFENVKKEMEMFFTQDKDADVIVQWKTRMEHRVKDFYDELVKGTESKISELMKLKTMCKSFDDKKKLYENKLFNRSTILASEWKGKATDEQELKMQFDSMWEKWLSEIKREMSPIKDFHVEQEALTTLNSSFEAGMAYSRRQSGLYRQISLREEYTNYLTVKKNWGIFHHSLDTNDHDSVRELVQQTVREAEKTIGNAPVAKTGYSNTYIQEIVNQVKKAVSEYKPKKFKFKNEFTVDLCLFVCETAVKMFTELHMVYREDNDPFVFLGNKKWEFFALFNNYCKGATATAVFVDFVCNKLKPSILRAAYDKAASDTAGEMRANYPAFNGNRSNLEKHILQDLAETEDFSQYITYFQNPKKHFSQFIAKSVKEQMFEGENPRILHILKNALKQKHLTLSRAITKVTEVVKEEGGDVEKWLNRFSAEVDEEMNFSTSDLVGIQYQEVTDTNFLGEEMSKTLQSVTENLTSNFNSISSIDLKMLRRRPEDILIEQLCGCWVQCPFCKAMCTNTIEGHDGDHSVPFHRPHGVNGVTWALSDILAVNICTSLVASDTEFITVDKICKFKSYRDAGPQYACWAITPDSSEQSYWKWFVCKFQKDLEKEYQAKFHDQGEIPAAWRTISKEDALKSLNDTI